MIRFALWQVLFLYPVVLVIAAILKKRSVHRERGAVFTGPFVGTPTVTS